ncbi:MAG: RidA family protein [Pseudomonadota bacterium]
MDKELMRQQINSGSPFEDRIGFSRACRVGPYLAIAGTAPICADGKVAHEGDVYAQTRRCFELVAEAVHEAGLQLSDVIRTRIMLTNIDEWERAAVAHREFFADIKPACTFVEVSRFIDKHWLVEVEADCVASTDK